MSVSCSVGAPLGRPPLGGLRRTLGEMAPQGVMGGAEFRIKFAILIPLEWVPVSEVPLHMRLFLLHRVP